MPNKTLTLSLPGNNHTLQTTKLMMKIGKFMINNGDKQQLCQTFMQLLSFKNIKNYKNVYQVTVRNYRCEVAFFFT